MSITFTIQSLLIYQTMGLYLLAFVISSFRHKRIVWLVYSLGFVVAVISVVYRGLTAGYFPLKNLFEVFLFLAVLIFPLSVFCKRYFKVGGEMFDMLLGSVVLLPAVFVFTPEGQFFSPSLEGLFFVPHAVVYVLSYIILAKAACQASLQLVLTDGGNYGLSVYKLLCLGFPLLTAGLILGSIWAKFAWSDFWSWGPGQMWALATWLVYLGYFNYSAVTGIRYTKTSALWALTGFLFILITASQANLSHLFAGLYSFE